MRDDREGLAIVRAANAAQTPEDELEVARQVYGIFDLMMALEPPPQRIKQVAAQLGMEPVRVRRYVALHIAPSEIRLLYIQGKLSARAVELLQVLSIQGQRLMAKQLIDGRETLMGLENELSLESKRTVRRWTAEAKLFEQQVLRAKAVLEPYLTGPRGMLTTAFQGIGSGAARRVFVSTLETMGEEILMLAQILEMWTEDPKGDKHEQHRVAVGDAGGNGSSTGYPAATESG